VKVLGGGQVRRELRVTADAFTAGAVELIEEGWRRRRHSPSAPRKPLTNRKTLPTTTTTRRNQ